MRSYRPVILTSVAACAALALLAAGCGGGVSPQVASVTSSTTTATTGGGVVAFTHCMRANGVPRFPDPPPLGSHVHQKLTLEELGVSKVQVRAAERVCNHLLPNDGNDSQQTEQQTRTQLADALSFAKCMRTHGVPRFPDPSARNGLSTEMVQAQGIDVHSPAFLHVVQVCLPASHGGLTAAKVRAAIANAGP